MVGMGSRAGPQRGEAGGEKMGRREASRSPVLWESSYQKNLCMMGPPEARMKKLLWSLHH